MPPSPSSSSSLPPLSPVNADGNDGGRGGRIIITRSEGGNGLVVRVATKEDDDDDAVGSDAGGGGGDGGDFLEDYMKCLRHLMDCDRFDLMTNERGEGGGGGRRREARKGDPPRRRAPPPDDDAGTEGSKKKMDGGGRNGGLFVVCPPEDADGLGISPLCLCVGRLVGAGDALRPLLDLLLARGFDSNATENVVARGGGVGGSGGGGGGAASSALHIALRNAHHGCALALARAGANVNAPRPEDGVTALRVASATYGDGFARELREAGVVAMAVADPSRRRDLLRSPGGEGG